MIRALITDFSYVLLLPVDKNYTGGLNALHKKLSANGDYDFWSHFRLNQELLDFYQKLSRTIDVFIFTTGTIQEYPPLAEKLKGLFKGIFSSTRLNWDKNDPKTFEMLAEKVGLRPDEILYADDKGSNLEAAQTAGMRTLAYISNESLEKDVMDLQRFPVPKVTAGILLFNSRKYLPDCLGTLLKQDYPNFEILILDNADNASGDTDFVKQNYPQIKIERGPNIGFGAGHNQLIRKAAGEFYACLNVDMRFEPDFIRNLVEAIQKDLKTAVATGKLLRWDFEKGINTNQIDTVGLKLFRSHRFEDEGQGSVDCGQYDAEREIFGSSGAAFLARMEALRDVAFDGQYFDELMFMYKEDIDLAYRFRWAGWKAVYTPRAVAYHDRTTANREGGGLRAIVANRKNISPRVREWSYRNHLILLAKNFSGFSWRVRFATAWYQFKTLVYIFFAERYLLKKRGEVRTLAPQIEARRAAMKRRITPEEMERWMQ